MKTLKKTMLPALLLTMILLLMLLSVSFIGSSAAQAGTTNWSRPINVSGSGSSSDPEIVVDINGGIHIIWLDEYEGYRYTQLTPEGEWTQPVTKVFPFGENKTRLIRETEESVDAFWIDEDESLFISRKLMSNFGLDRAWGAPVLLASEAKAYDVAVNSNGIVHLVYLGVSDSTEVPSGIYHRKSIPGTESWTEPKLIFPSLYLRSLPVEEINISVSAGMSNDEEVVYAAWDVSSLSKIFFSKTINEGGDWIDPIEVDAAVGGTGSSAPFGIDVTIWNDQLLLLWNRGSAEGSCTTLYQASFDQGETWFSRGSIATGLSGCYTGSKLLTGNSNALFLGGSINNQVYLTAWDGTQWSEPQVQQELSNTEDPITNRTVNLGMWNIMHLSERNSLLAVGSDLNGNSDIWFTSKVIDDIQSWFPPETAWRIPSALFRTQVEAKSLNLLKDGNETIHSLWVQAFGIEGSSTQESSSTARDAIYYSSWDGKTWTQPAAILQNQRGKASQLASVITNDGILLVTWQGDQTGEIYFSHVEVARASRSAEWSEPVTITDPTFVSTSPQIAVWQDEIYVLYTIPINEKRGVYITRSRDAGKTWSEPFLVFDGQSAGWELVSSPSLEVTYDGQIHAMWIHDSLPGTRGALGLFYARSKDKGENWEPVEQVGEGNILWGKLISTNNGSLYQVWNDGSGQNNIYTRISENLGDSWSSLEKFARPGITDGPIGLFTDPASKLYMTQFFLDQFENLTLQVWEKQNKGWIMGDQTYAVRENEKRINALAGIVTRAGVMTVVYATSSDPESSEPLQYLLSYTNQIVEMPGFLPTPPFISPVLVTPEGTSSTSNAALTPTAMPSPTPTVYFGQDNALEPITTEDNTLTGITISIMVSGVIVAIGFLIMLSRNRSR